MKKRIIKILAKAPKFTTKTCSGVGYHGSNKGEERSFTIYEYKGESYYNLDDAKVAFVLNELEKEVKKLV